MTDILIDNIEWLLEDLQHEVNEENYEDAIATLEDIQGMVKDIGKILRDKEMGFN